MVGTSEENDLMRIIPPGTAGSFQPSAIGRISATPATLFWQSKEQTTQEDTMRWYHYLAYFFGGIFLANALPHFGNGVSGHAFQSPFASPPGVGLSSSTVNVLWGLFNLAIAYLLVCRVGSFDLRKTQHILVLGAGFVAMSLNLAHYFGQFHGGM
jgi:hypothetical protein